MARVYCVTRESQFYLSPTHEPYLPLLSNSITILYAKYLAKMLRMVQLRNKNMYRNRTKATYLKRLETYKILSGKYDMVAVPNLIKSTILTTRGNDLRLQKTRTRYDLHKFFFTNRVVNLWNSLPNSVVHAESTNMFKTRWINFG